MRGPVLLIPGVVLLASACGAAAEGGPASKPAPRPVEWGKIDWLRDWDIAAGEAGKHNKPVMVLFDEVPGCGTCKKFGAGPLSHPIVVDAAGEFACLLVNNHGRYMTPQDKAGLQRFGERPYSNPVVRFVDASGKDVVAREAGDWTTQTLVARMAGALRAAGRAVPAYLALAAAEYKPSARETACLAMGCYWTGEKAIGAIDGVLRTRIGFLARSEVVEVTFDPQVVDFASLLARAKAGCGAHRVFARTDQQAEAAKAVDGVRVHRTNQPAVTDKTVQKYNMAFRPQYWYLPLTESQAARVNSAIASRKAPDVFLSPTQLALKRRIEAVLAAGKSLPRRPPAFPRLKPDRSAAGIVGYAAELETFLAGQAGRPQDAGPADGR